MRFLMTVNGGGRPPDEQLFADMGRFVEELTLAGLLRDVGLAEELAQDALVAALEQWPAEGIPANPGGWLMLTARHRAIDRIRRNERLAAKLSLLGRELETAQDGATAEFDDVLDEGTIDDDLL